jgi:predicted patatin/cPLA2 family phospholipase
MHATVPQHHIVLAGGGLQASFIAGALAELNRLGPTDALHHTHVTATSASMATFMYYLSGTGHLIGEKIWTHDIPNSHFLAFKSLKCLFKSKPVYNIPHMVDVIFKQNNTLDENHIQNHPTHFCFPLLNIDTRKVEIFSNKPELAKTFFPNHIIRNWLEYDVYNLIHASCAVPMLYDKPIKLGEYSYCDIGLHQPFAMPLIPRNTSKALYMVIREKTNKDDFKVSLLAAIWLLRAAFKKAGLPWWVYASLVTKPFLLSSSMRRLRKTIPNLTLVSATTPLMSSLQNTPESALHNWRAGEAHITARTEHIAKHFWSH